MRRKQSIVRTLAAFAASVLAVLAVAAPASAQLQPGDILVVDPDVPPVSTGVLLQVDPQTGARTALSNFGATNPTAVAVEADGGILVTDTDAGTDPNGGTSEWGVLYRISPDPITGVLTRVVLTDFGIGPNTGRTPRAVAVEADGQILVINGVRGTSSRGVLVRVDPVTGARAIVSDFGDSGQGELGVEPRGVAVEAGGQILVIDAQAGQGTTGNGLGVLFRINPQTGDRASLSNFGVGPSQGSNPTSLAVETDGSILVSDEGHPSTTPLGLLFRVDPATGGRAVLSDFNTGANTGREPEGVALEADGQILVVDKHAGALTRGMLFRVDPQTGARTIVSDFAVGPNGGSDPSALAVVPPRRATLTVVNEVVNDNGGSADESDWTMSVSGGNPSPASFAGAAAPGTTVTLDPGAYSVSASGPPGYTTTSSADCTGTIAGGETKTCTITHDDQPGTLVVINEVVNDNGGTAVASDWTTIVTGGNPTPASFPGAGPPGTSVTLDAGAFDLLSNPPDGYHQTFSGDCVGTIALGETKTCTITGNDQPSLLYVVNEVVNDNGGTASASDWTINVTSVFGDDTFPGEPAPGTLLFLFLAGPFSVSSSGPAGYATTASPECGGTFAIGDPTRICTLTHDDQPATLVVVNEVVNDDGGSAVPGDVRMTVTGGDPSPASFTGKSAPGTTVTLDAGSYEVDVAGPPGYTNFLAPDCTAIIGLGETKTCTITSEDQNEPATLIVAVEVVMDNGGTLTLADFDAHISLPSGHTSTPRDFPAQGPPGTTVSLDPGSYGVFVSGPGAVPWTRDFDPGCSGTIAALETKSCTIVVDDVPATLLVIQEVVNDDGGTAAPGDFTVTVNGGDPSPSSFPGKGALGTTVTLDAGSYSVNVNGPPGYTSTFSPECAASAGLGDLRTCVITSDDDPPATPTCDGKVATILGTPGPSEVRGTSGNDVIVDLDGDNTVRGRGGSDTICTGPGNDQVFAGDGADTVIDTGGRNTVRTGAGADTVGTVGGADTIELGAGNDTATDTGGANSVDAGAGHDTIATGAGNDTIDAGAGNDTVSAGAGNNTVNGQAGDDTITTGAGNDMIDGGLGYDRCAPGTGANIVRRCEAVT